MRITARRWQICALIYRTLVAAQTLGWAIGSLAMVVARHTRSPSSAHRLAITLGAASVAAIVGGLVAYYLRRPRSHDRDAVVFAWACFQAAGLLALTGYAVTRMRVFFLLGIITLGVMHAFSPNRFQTRLGVDA